MQKVITACADPSLTHYVLLATGCGTHGGWSGYNTIAQYLPESLLLNGKRSDPSGLFERVSTRAIAQFAGTRWYRLDSLVVEWRALRMIRIGRARLIHLLWADRDWGYVDFFARRYHVPLCATFHTCPDTLPLVLRSAERLKRLAAVILMSDVQRPFFESQGVAPERIHVIHHGVDCTYFRPAKLSKPAPFTVLSVGNYRRNFDRLKKVCVALAARADIRIKIVAPPEQRKAFADIPNVEFISRLNNDELRMAYQSASCLLMTVDAATANNTVLEAMACGLPIVSEDVGGIGEYTGRECAALRPPGSVDALAKAILELCAQPHQVKLLGAGARARAVNLDWPKVAQRTVSVYEQVLTNTKVTVASSSKSDALHSPPVS